MMPGPSLPGQWRTCSSGASLRETATDTYVVGGNRIFFNFHKCFPSRLRTEIFFSDKPRRDLPNGVPFDIGNHPVVETWARGTTTAPLCDDSNIDGGSRPVYDAKVHNPGKTVSETPFETPAHPPYRTVLRAELKHSNFILPHNVNYGPASPPPPPLALWFCHTRHKTIHPPLLPSHCTPDRHLTTPEHVHNE